MRQGNICIVKLDPTVGHEQSKTRPCVILSSDSLNMYMGTVIIAPITSKKFDFDYPNIVKLNNDLLKISSSVKVEQLRCIDKSRIEKIIGNVSKEELNNLQKALEIIFD